MLGLQIVDEICIIPGGVGKVAGLMVVNRHFGSGTSFFAHTFSKTFRKRRLPHKFAS